MNVTGILSSTNSAASSINQYLLQIASGKKSLFNDPAGAVIGVKMGAQVSQDQAAMRNLQNEQGQLNIQAGSNDAAMAKISRLGELTIQAQGGNLSQTDVANIQTEVDQIVGSMDNAAGLGLEGMDVAADPQAAQQAIEGAQQQMAQTQVLNGAQSNVKEFQYQGMQNAVENQMAAQSKLSDTNLALAMAGLGKSNTKQMMAYSMLKQSQGIMSNQVNLLM